MDYYFLGENLWWSSECAEHNKKSELLDYDPTLTKFGKIKLVNLLSKHILLSGHLPARMGWKCSVNVYI